MIGIIPVSPLSVEQIRILRQITKISISAIRQASTEQMPALIIEPFCGDWENKRLLLANLYYNWHDHPNPPFTLREINKNNSGESISFEQFKNRLRHWLDIEQETEMISDLENGYIDSPDTFSPHDEDWKWIS